MLGIVAAGAIVKMGGSVLIPLTVAFFLMLMLQPLSNWTANRVDLYLGRLKARFGRTHKSEESALANAFSMILVLLVFIVFSLGIYLLARGQVTLILSKQNEIVSNIIQPVEEWIEGTNLLDTTAPADSVMSDIEAIPESGSTVGSVSPADSSHQSGDTMLSMDLNRLKESLLGILPSAAEPIISTIFTFIMILFLTTFLLIGRRNLEKNLQDNPHIGRIQHIVVRVESNTRKFILTKIVTSLMTGVGVALVLDIFFLQTQDALIWGSVYFVMNFIPIYGSLIAGVGTILYTMAIYNPSNFISAWPVIPMIMAINIAVSNGIEPRLMQKNLPIGSVTVLLVVILWAWLWGAWGMFLAVPITIMFKVMLEETRGSRYWLCILMET